MLAHRVSFYGGPGSGKSTLSARVFAEMKMRGYNVEQVTEYVKQMAYEGRSPQSFDQLFIFAEQLHREDLVLRHVPIIVTDCPPLMNVSYARALGFARWKELLDIALEWEKEHPSLNFFIQRTVPYRPEGRFQTEKDADMVAADIWAMVTAHLKYEVVSFGTDEGQITNFASLMDRIAEGSVH